MVEGKVKLVGETLAWVAEPVKLINCGLPPPLSAIETSAVRVPVVFGLKVTLTEQLAFFASTLPHVFDRAKSPESLPVKVMLVKVSVVVPTLVIVTLCGLELLPIFVAGKLKPDADNLTCVPVPVKLIDWGLLAALSVIFTVPVRVPSAVGLNVTLMVQVAFTARELPHVLVSE